MTSVEVQLLHPMAVAPRYAHDGDAGADLVCVVDVHLEPGERKLVNTGIAIAIPQGWVGLVHPRSGLAVKQGLGIVNAPGTIDAGYRGEVMVCLINLDAESPIDLPAGSRIAQLVIQRVERADFPLVEQLPPAERGLGGFGSTGVGA
jgi:dUTP pyrophosphatase